MLFPHRGCMTIKWNSPINELKTWTGAVSSMATRRMENGDRPFATTWQKGSILQCHYLCCHSQWKSLITITHVQWTDLSNGHSDEGYSMSGAYRKSRAAQNGCQLTLECFIFHSKCRQNWPFASASTSSNDDRNSTGNEGQASHCVTISPFKLSFDPEHLTKWLSQWWPGHTGQGA